MLNIRTGFGLYQTIVFSCFEPLFSFLQQGRRSVEDGVAFGGETQHKIMLPYLKATNVAEAPVKNNVR
jgi:hypothetical protein